MPAVGSGDRVPVVVAIHAKLPVLRAGERRVCEALLADPTWATEATAGEVAQAVGVSTATVVRAAQALGYSGFPQLRVTLARDLGAMMSIPPGRGPYGVVEHYFRAVAEAVPGMLALVSPEQVSQAVDLLVKARHILVVGNGVSAPVAHEFELRLTSIGRLASSTPDVVHQQIRARLLGAKDVCVIVSATGATAASLAVANECAVAGASVIAVTSFTGSPLAAQADVELVVGMGLARLSEELRDHVRLPHSILLNALVAAVAAASPKASASARAKAIDVAAAQLQH